MRKQSLSNPSSPGQAASGSPSRSGRRMYPLSDSDSDISESLTVSIASSVQDLERKVRVVSCVSYSNDIDGDDDPMMMMIL